MHLPRIIFLYYIYTWKYISCYFLFLFFKVCKGQLFAQTGQALLRSEDTVNHEVKIPNIQFPFRGSRYSSLYVSTTSKKHLLDTIILNIVSLCMWQTSRVIHFVPVLLNVICKDNMANIQLDETLDENKCTCMYNSNSNITVYLY